MVVSWSQDGHIYMSPLIHRGRYSFTSLAIVFPVTLGAAYCPRGEDNTLIQRTMPLFCPQRLLSVDDKTVGAR